MSGRVGGSTSSTQARAVFISCASQEAAVAHKVVDALERTGICCWIAPRDVIPGALYADEIIRAINECSVLVLLLSSHSAASPHVGRELERASSKKRRIIAVRLDTTALPPAFEYFLSESQWIDIVSGGIESAAVKLTEAVGHHLNPAPAASPALPQVAAKPAVAPSIAVLPFSNLSGDKEQEYFSDGLAEELINALSKLPGLKVIARSSAFAFRGQNADIRRIAEVLGVAHVLEGSVRRSGNRIRVTAQLIAAIDGTQRWSERYDRELADVFAVQDDIAAAITSELQGKLTPTVPALRYTPKLPAYEALLRARHLHWRVTADAMDKARVCYEQAIALDPQFALAYAEYAEYLMARAYLDLSQQSEMAPLSRRLAQKALLLDPSLTDAHASLCVVAGSHDRDWKEAHRQFLLVTADGRCTPLSRMSCAWGYLLPSGQVDAAVAQLELAVQEDPLHATYRSILAICLSAAGRTDEAESILLETAALSPDQVMPRLYLAYNCYFRNRLSEALAMVESLAVSAPWYLQGMVAYAGLLSRSGETERAKSVLQRLDPESPGFNTRIAMFHLFCGEPDRAADCFEKALADNEATATMMLQTALSKELRASARWPRLAELLNLA